MLVRLPQAMLNTWPDISSSLFSQASRFAETTFSTKVKSRDCPPFPKITGDLSSLIRSINFGITAEYCELGSCLGPNTLKYRNITVSSPYIRVNTWQYFSPASFDTAYGERGTGIISSVLGRDSRWRYTDEDDANTTRF